MGSVTHRRLGALGERMLSHLCPAVDPVLVQPQIPDPLPPALSSLRVCPDQTPMLLSTQLTLLLQLVSDPSSHSGSRSRSSDREQASLPSAPLSLSGSTPTLCLAVQALWGPFSPHLSVHTGSSVPEPGAVCRIQKEGGPAVPSRSSRGRPCPPWVHLTIYESPHWHPTPVLLPGESRGRGSLVGCRLGLRRVGHD